jgi:undecaprenyl-diphosphatase
MQVNDTFAGPSLEPKHHSFPSGHTSSSFSCATPLFLYHPVLGSPAMAGAAAIGLSRAHKSQHYLSDLVAGFWVGLACSLPAYTLLGHKKTKSPIE